MPKKEDTQGTYWQRNPHYHPAIIISKELNLILTSLMPNARHNEAMSTLIITVAGDIQRLLALAEADLLPLPTP